MSFCKRFIFGRHKDDPKGPPEEHGEVAIEAASLAKAREAFVEKHGANDKRFPIVRAEWIGETAAKPAKAKRARKR